MNTCIYKNITCKYANNGYCDTHYYCIYNWYPKIYNAIEEYVKKWTKKDTKNKK